MTSRKVRTLNFFRSLFKNRPSERIIIALIRSGSVVGKLGTKLAPNNYQYPKRTFRLLKRNGLSFNVDISEYVGHYLYFGFRDEGYNELMRLAAGKKTVFDVGANLGFTATNMSQAIAEGGIVYAFEPDPYNYERLKENLALNPQAAVAPQNVGLGNEAAQLKLAVVTPDNLGGNRIAHDAESDFTLVDITTMDTFCDANNISRIDLIKIDVEGFEMNVLKGGNRMITTHLPDMFIEIDDSNLKIQGHSAKEVIAFLEAHYSTIYDAESKRPVTSSDDFTNCHFDVVAKAKR
jgi:FkbM family methyltransferase